MDRQPPLEPDRVAFGPGGVRVALPEGEEASAAALVSFARLDGTNRLLGGQVAAFDMRAPDRIYLRVPGRSEPKPVPAPAANEAKPDSQPEESN